MAYERMLDKAAIPDETAMLSALGPAKALWVEMHEYIRKNFDFSPETVFFTKRYGWSVRYRKGRRTLCYVFPEAGSFSALIILGKEEVLKTNRIKEQCNESVRRVFEETEQLHDGRWLWIRATDMTDVQSLQLLLAVKAKRKANPA